MSPLPTALDVVRNEGVEGRLNGKVVLITGCSSGIGIDTAEALAKTGATVHVTARDLGKVQSALGSLLDSPKVRAWKLDLASFASVRQFAADFLAENKTLNILVLNAGIMATPEGKTMDGFETQLGTNHLGHFLLFKLLQSTLLASATPEFNSRVVAVSSSGHRAGEVNFDNLNFEGIYNAWLAYGQSKTANIWMANEIERKFSSQGLHAWSLHPGGIATGLQQHLPKETLQLWLTAPESKDNWISSGQGAATTVWAAISKGLEGKGGQYLQGCKIVGEWDPETGETGVGHAAWAFDEAKEKKLWNKSLELVGLKED